ncbi:MAG: OprO/OprP family phosphate-selective porin [Colwellia sp.]|nr:OprO/OprP family phosphate-selective porin [Colwellia sp.]
MKNIKLLVICSVALCIFTHKSFADIDFTGFASFNAGQVLSGTGVPHYDVPPTFLADYPLVSAYDEDISFKPETLFGLQVRADLMDGLSATAQIVSRGANDFETQFEWAYISYELNDNWTIQAGKKRLPLFYYSDFFDIGYAYVWMRAPADTYTWQIFNYNGINALYSSDWGDWSVSGNIYTGSEDDSRNKLLSDFFFFEDTREIWKDIFGGVFQVSKDWLEIRLTAMTYENERYRNGEQVFWDGESSRTGNFYGLAANLDFEELFILSEFNRLDLDGNLDTMMLTVGYRLDSLTPFISYSDFQEKNGEDGEDHNTTSVGLRWDFHPSAAFKVQYDKVQDNSFELAVAGDSESLTVGVDLVF